MLTNTRKIEIAHWLPLALMLVALITAACTRVEPPPPCTGGIGLYGGETSLIGQGDVELAWAPDGSSILFGVSRSSVELVDLSRFPEKWDSQEVAPLSERNAFSVDWSPDGKKIVFMSRNEENSISLYDLVTKQIRQLTTGQWDGDPRWSPDGGQIAFRRVSSDGDGSVGQLYVMNPDGTNALQLTRDSPFFASWSPDGQQLLYVSEDSPHDIFVIDADGANRRQLTDTEFCESTPSWSPDGQRIAYLAAPDGVANIYLMNSGGGGTVKLTDSTDDFGQIAWSPDGEWIATIGDIGVLNNYWQEIYLVHSDGGQITELTNTRGVNESLPLWSPDGKYVAYLTFDGGNWNLNIIPSSGGTPVRVASIPASEPYSGRDGAEH